MTFLNFDQKAGFGCRVCPKLSKATMVLPDFLERSSHQKQLAPDMENFGTIQPYAGAK
jgi:hypothetical protein